MNKCNGSVMPPGGSSVTKALLPHKDKDGCGSGNDGDDEEEYGLKKSVYKNATALGYVHASLIAKNFENRVIVKS